MKREDLELESRIAEAVRAAAGVWRTGSVASQAEAATGRDAGAGGSAERLATAFGDLLSRLDALARPATTAVEGGWKGVVSSLNPIMGGLLRLFGGGELEGPAAPAAAVRPAAAKLELGYGSGREGYFMVDRDASGMVRAGAPVGAPTVVVNIDTIDSRSFLERTPEIAEAVKRVILEAEGMREVFGALQE